MPKNDPSTTPGAQAGERLTATPCRHCGAYGVPVQAPGSGMHYGSLRCPHCNTFLRWLPRPRTPQEQAAREAKRQSAIDAHMHKLAPTDAQLSYLTALGYTGIVPVDRLVASRLIDALVQADTTFNKG